MRIANNLMAMNAHRQLVINQGGIAKSIEKLSSGLRINRAGDDAAGLAISEKMRGQIRGLNQAMRNAQDGISLIQTAEGALQETHSILQRMRELAVQANNGTNTEDDLNEIQKEIDQLKSELTRIAQKTEFNTKTLLDGSLGVKIDDDSTKSPLLAGLTSAGIAVDVSGVKANTTLTFTVNATDNELSISDGTTTQVIRLSDVADVKAGTTLDFDKIGVKLSFAGDVDLTEVIGSTDNTLQTKGEQLHFQIGPNAGTVLSVSINDMSAEGLGTNTGTSIDSIADLNVVNQDFDEYIKVIDQAISQVSAERSQLGALQNRLEHTIANLGASAENLQAAESRIRDVDMAAEMMNFTKYQILQQASTAMLAQANLAPQSVLQLLG